MQIPTKVCLNANNYENGDGIRQFTTKLGLNDKDK